jgi:hypothetical protein
MRTNPPTFHYHFGRQAHLHFSGIPADKRGNLATSNVKTW